MAQTQPALEDRRTNLLRELSQLGDFRPGSITTTSGRCGNPGCHCHQPDQPGHGPNLRLTYKVEGKTVTETFPSAAAQRKVQREIDAYRRWQELSRELVEVSAAICRLRPLSESTAALSGPEKKRWKPSSRKSLARSARSSR
jgi:hypothetical protein